MATYQRIDPTRACLTHMRGRAVDIAMPPGERGTLASAIIKAHRYAQAKPLAYSRDKRQVRPV